MYMDSKENKHTNKKVPFGSIVVHPSNQDSISVLHLALDPYDEKTDKATNNE